MKQQNGYITRKSGSWLGHYSLWITDHSTGKRRRKQRAVKLGAIASMKKSDAQDALRERLVEELGRTADSSLTVNGFITQHWKPMREGSWRESTAAVTAEHLKVLTARFGDTPLEEMEPVALQSWLTELSKKYSASLVRRMFILLRSILGEACELGFFRKNPARLLRMPKTKAVKHPYLNLEQVGALLKAARFQPRDYTMIAVALTTAMRPGELLALRWEDISFKRGTVTLRRTMYRGKLRPYTKTTEEDELPVLVLPELAVAALNSWYGQTERKGEKDYIFPNEIGGFLSKENFSKRVLKELAKYAEPRIPRVNFQILRRTYATHAATVGSLKSVQALMRHKKADVTANIYIQTITADVRETSEAMGRKMLQR